MLAPATPPPRVLAAVAATRRRMAVVGWLRVLWPVAMAAALVGLAGPVIARFPPAAASLVAICVWAGLGWLLWRRLHARSPVPTAEARRRLEAFHGLSDQAPLTGLGDRPATGDTSLWDWQQARAFALLPVMTRPAPWPFTPLDGLAALGLAIVAGVVALSPVQALSGYRIDLSPLVGDGPITSELWATPPDYTGAPAVRLDGAGGPVTLPQGTLLDVRVDGPRAAPRIVLPGRDRILIPRPGGGWHGRMRLDQSGRVAIHRLGDRGHWTVTITPDNAPVLAELVEIEAASRGRVQVGFTASDDYGVVAARLLVAPVESLPGLPESMVPPIPLTLPQNRGPVGQGGTPEAMSLSAAVVRHPLAGMRVRARLEVSDAAGQTSRSEPVTLVLPEFTPRTLLAASFLEVRTLLLQEARPYAAIALADASLIDPRSGETLRGNFAAPLEAAPPGVRTAEQRLAAIRRAAGYIEIDPVGQAGLAMVLAQLRAARDVTSAHAVEADLWDLAMRVNGATGTPAQQRMAEARDALADALENGAPESEIEQLMQDYRAAIGERLGELAREQGRTTEDMQIEQPEGETLSSQDLAQMLDELEDSGTSGDRGDALQQLSQLDELMANLEAGGQSGSSGPEGGSQAEGDGSGGGAGSPGGQAGAGQGASTSALREQQRLSDETQARSAQARESGREPDTLDDLAGEQQALAGRLRQQAEDGSPGGEAAGRAAEAMEEAARALLRNDANAARQAQERATRALREAGQARRGNSGNGQGNAGQTRDPLGRPAEGFDDGDGTEVPEQMERRQARDIRDLLRKRQSEPDRSEDERSYLDRLLEGF